MPGLLRDTELASSLQLLVWFLSLFVWGLIDRAKTGKVRRPGRKSREILTCETLFLHTYLDLFSCSFPSPKLLKIHQQGAFFKISSRRNPTMCPLVWKQRWFLSTAQKIWLKNNFQFCKVKRIRRKSVCQCSSPSSSPFLFDSFKLFIETSSLGLEKHGKFLISSSFFLLFPAVIYLQSQFTFHFCLQELLMHFSITSRTQCVMINSVERNQITGIFRAEGWHFSLPKTGLGQTSYYYSSRQARDRAGPANCATRLSGLKCLCLNNCLLSIAPWD